MIRCSLYDGQSAPLEGPCVHAALYCVGRLSILSVSRFGEFVERDSKKPSEAHVAVLDQDTLIA